MKRRPEKGQGKPIMKKNRATLKMDAWEISPWKTPGGEDGKDERYNPGKDKVQMASDKEDGPMANPTMSEDDKYSRRGN